MLRIGIVFYSNDDIAHWLLTAEFGILTLRITGLEPETELRLSSLNQTDFGWDAVFKNYHLAALGEFLTGPADEIGFETAIGSIHVPLTDRNREQLRNFVEACRQEQSAQNHPID